MSEDVVELIVASLCAAFGRSAVIRHKDDDRVVILPYLL